MGENSVVFDNNDPDTIFRPDLVTRLKEFTIITKTLTAEPISYLVYFLMKILHLIHI